ncbi:MAG: tetratricopeptide repeat protein, partial [Sedimentisphaerales bacterium]|nr:tetratricopeptide repeat protein [Sedimentisphaerales bacterium]
AEAFEAAKQLASNKETAERLDAVIEAAKTGKPVIPDDCFGTADASALSPRKTVSPSDKAALALSMGIINLIAGRLDNADDCFNRVLGTPAVRPTSDTPGRPAKPVMKGATRAQLAFATFGRGAVRHAHKQMDEAKEQFIASMKAYRDGSWHDETLYRIATIMQNNAEVKYGYIGSDSIPAGGKKSDTDKSSKPPTEKECEAAKKAEQERLATRAKAFGEVLPYWQELTERYPESPRCEPAMYNTGLLLYEIAVATDSSDQSRIKTKQAWKTALATLSRFTDTFPQSLEAGDAYVRQIDIVLEQMLDIKQSLRLIESGLAWAEAQDVDLETHADGSLTTGTINRAIQSLSQTDQSLPIWADRGQLLQPRSLLDVLYNLHLRAGILAYAQEDYDQAVDHFKAAGPAHLTDGMQGNFDRQKVGLHAMLICSQRKEPAWSREITDAVRNEQDQFLLKLADTYLHAGRPEKAEAIYRQFTESGSRSRSAAASYSRMRLALALSQDRANTDQAIEFYKSFYDRGQADYPWAADAILRLGVLIQNTRGDSAAALSHFAYVHTKYPDHPEAERAMYFHCVAASWIEDKEQVRKVAEKFLAKYPQSQWHKAVENIKKKNTP